MGKLISLSNATNGFTYLSRWEYLHSFHVEWALMRGRLPLRPSMVSSHILFNSAEMTIGQDPISFWTDMPLTFPHSFVSIEGAWLGSNTFISITAQPGWAHTQRVSVVYVSLSHIPILLAIYSSSSCCVGDRCEKSSPSSDQFVLLTNCSR